MEIKAQDLSSAGAARGEPPVQELPPNVEAALEMGKIQTDGKLIEAMAQKEEENKNNPQSTGESGKDQAVLSRESRPYRQLRSQSAVSEEKQGREILELAWKSLQNWAVSLDISLESELLNLGAMYEKLVEQMLLYGTQETTGGQPGTLDQILSEVLSKILNTRLGELNGLFKAYGTQGSVRSLQTALYRSVTGHSPDQGELDRVFKVQRDFDAEAGDFPVRGGIRTPVNQGSLSRGIIYQPDGQGRIVRNERYTDRMEMEFPLAMKAGREKAYGAEASISAMGKNRVYSPADLEPGERFAGYISRRGNLFAAQGISGTSGELYGFLAAVMAIKSQTYAAISPVEKEMSSDLRSTVDKMIDLYIQEEAARQEGDNKAGTGIRKGLFEPRAAYKTYYYMMNLYQTTGDLQEVINKGLRHAYRQYLKKRESAGEDEKEGFFFSKEKREALEDWKDGKRILERDWREFLNFLEGEGLGHILPGLLELSPWGMFAEPEKPSEKRAVSPAVVFGVLAGLILLMLFLGFMGR
ncbi:MAG: hypothetical protein QM657_19065 [Lacrimispora sp.]|uniref:hypothetical protein n=1 Tax=Lacrimispora sp. TaxID=2719234 RepID=UPI0039E2FA73